MRRRNLLGVAVATLAAVGTMAGPAVVSGASTVTITQRGTALDGVADYDYTGQAVAISEDGTRVAIGGATTDGNGTNSGQVRVFDWNGTAWVQVGANLNGEAAGDRFGQAVAMSADGDRIAVGANKNGGNGSEAGHVRVFDWNGTAWVQVGADLDGDSAGDNFGSTAALSADGERLVVGGPGTAVGDTGYVAVYDWTGSAWAQAGADLVGEATDDRFGRSVATSADGDRIVVGATGNDAAGTSAGHARVFDWTGTAWSQVGADIDGLAAQDYFGTSVTISGDGSHVAVGATSSAINGEYSGYAQVFDWSGTAWTAVGSTIEGEAGDELGNGLALTADGSRLAVGSYYGEGAYTDDGVTRLYEFIDSDWVQQGDDIDGTSDFEQSGFALAMTPDGSVLAIGGVGFDVSAGRVRVFEVEWPAGELPPLDAIPGNVVLSPGQALATVAGSQVPVTLTRDGATVRLTGSDFAMDLTGLDEGGSTGQLDSDGNLILRAGGYAAVSGSGFAPESPVQVYLFSTPTLLGIVDTDANGEFEATLPIPVDTPAGTHTVQANGYTADGEIRSLNVGVIVPGVDLLPPTGRSSMVLLLGVAVVVAGGASMLVTRRVPRRS